MKLVTSTVLLLSTRTLVSVLASSSNEHDTSIQKVQIPDTSIEKPDVFTSSQTTACTKNAVVAAWCDTNIGQQVECGILHEFDEYGCSCHGDPSLCPTECIDATEPIQKTHYGIRCNGIPIDVPNYILKERHVVERCEANSVVAAWCDDYVNKHLECKLYTEDDQYLCKCSGKQSNCPDECINGAEPIVRSHNSVLCAGIPSDNPNYILKQPKVTESS